MKKQLGITIMLAALASTPAIANDEIIGALIGGGAGAAVGHSIGGRNAAVIGGALGAAAGVAIANNNSGSRVVHTRSDYYAPPPPPAYYAPAPVAYPQQVYYAAPVRVERRVYYVEDGYSRSYYERRHPRHDRDWRHDERRHWDGGY